MALRLRRSTLITLIVFLATLAIYLHDLPSKPGYRPFQIITPTTRPPAKGTSSMILR